MNDKETKKDVLVNVVSLVMTQDDPDAQKIEMMIPGRLMRNKNDIFLFYEEDDKENGILTQVRIKITVDDAGEFLRAEITRKGNSSRYIIELIPGQTTESDFYSMGASLHMKIATKAIEFSRDENLMTLKLSYATGLDEEWLGDYFVVVEAKTLANKE